MICFHIYGGLGNQMFIYAFARQLKDTRNEPYCLSKIGKLNYFELTRFEAITNALKFLFFKFTEKLFNNSSRYFLKDQWKDYYDHVLSLEGNLALDGYFQGENYFRDVQQEIRQLFQVRERHKRRFRQLLHQEFNGKVLVIHIRRTDYHQSFQDLGIGTGSFALPLDYYFNALNKISDIDQHRIIIISDDIEFVKINFRHLNNVLFSEFDEIIDLQILMHADTLIIANSSFSWWGAWLNEKPAKKIFIPKYYLGFKVNKTFPVNIIPREWEQVEFTSPQ